MGAALRHESDNFFLHFIWLKGGVIRTSYAFFCTLFAPPPHTILPSFFPLIFSELKRK